MKTTTYVLINVLLWILLGIMIFSFVFLPAYRNYENLESTWDLTPGYCTAHPDQHYGHSKGIYTDTLNWIDGLAMRLAFKGWKINDPGQIETPDFSLENYDFVLCLKP